MRARTIAVAQPDFGMTRLGWKVSAVFGVFLVLGLSCLWLQNRVVEVSYQVKGLEQEISELNPRIVGLESELARMKSPSAIKGRLLDNEINMVIPFPEHEVHVKDGFGITRRPSARPRSREAS